jgi:hypothetical protein
VSFLKILIETFNVLYLQNGQAILDSLAELKHGIIDRYDKWCQAQQDGVNGYTTPKLESPSRRRPAKISELAERATVPWDESKEFKYYLRLAEKHRRDGKEYARSGDMENAFVELSKAATLVLEKLPEHPDYNVKLYPDQRHNLRLVRPF